MTQLELDFGCYLPSPPPSPPLVVIPPRFYLGIYESPLSWNGTSARVRIVSETDDLIRVQLQQNYPPFGTVGTELDLRQTEFQRAVGMTLPSTISDKRNWTSSLWTPSGEFVSYAILGIEEKLKLRAGR